MSVGIEQGGPSRQARLTVEPTGELLLRLGSGVTEQEANTFLSQKRNWIYRQLIALDDGNAKPVTKQLVNGEGFTYLGRNYRLHVSAGDTDTVSLIGGRLTLPEKAAINGSGPILIKEWYSSRFTAWLAPRLKQWAAHYLVEPARLDVIELGHKWGSHTLHGGIRVHWAAAQLPPRLIEYVAMHELAHLVEPNHSPRFWASLTRALPDAIERKEQLAAAGPKVWLGQVH